MPSSFAKAVASGRSEFSGSQIHKVPDAVTSVPLTSSLLNTPMSHKNRQRQNLHPLYHKRPPQQLLSLMVVVYVLMVPDSDVELCDDYIGDNKKASP